MSVNRTIFDLSPVLLNRPCRDDEEAMLWRNELRMRLWTKRDRTCDACGGRLNGPIHLHEGIVTRGDVRGWKYPEKALIFTELNCVWLHGECHVNPPSRQSTWDLQVGRYGEDTMREWYEGLPWKAGVPRRFWDG